MNQALTKADILAQPRAMPASQATHIEQSRAIAQVQGALVVAQQRPRDEIRAMQRVRDACAVQSLADRAFFRYNRGDGTVSGASIHLATELARCWGNIDFGITELARSDMKGESEMLSVAWDLETNTRVTNSFIVPHKRDKRGGAVPLTEMRDIYENNANNAARRLRECIFRVLPTHVVEEAKALCMATLEHGGGEPLVKRAEKMLDAFATIGISRRQIEKKVGVKADRLTAVDIANLGVIFTSIKRGEISKEEEFPTENAEDITHDLKQAAAPKPAPAAPAPQTNGAAEPNTVGDLLDELPPIQGAGNAAPQPTEAAPAGEQATGQSDAPAEGAPSDWQAVYEEVVSGAKAEKTVANVDDFWTINSEEGAIISRLKKGAPILFDKARKAVQAHRNSLKGAKS